MNIFSEIKEVSLPAMTVVSARQISNEPENEVIAFLHDWVARKGLSLEGCRCFGFDIPVSEEDKTAGKRGYEAWITITEDVAGDDRVTVKNIKADNYLTLRITDPFYAPFERIGEGWRILATEAQKRTAHKCCGDCSDRYCLEEVSEEKGKLAYMDIYCPI